MKLPAIPALLALLASSVTACLEFKTFDTGFLNLGGTISLNGLEICSLSSQTSWEGEKRLFTCIQPWLHAWQPHPRNGDMIIAYKNDFDGGVLKGSVPREFTIGKVDLRGQIGGDGGLEIRPWGARLEC